MLQNGDFQAAREISDLTSHPGWVRLVGLLRELEIGQLQRLYGAETDQDILLLVRQWQFFRRMCTVLKDEPERLAEEVRGYFEQRVPIDHLRDPKAPRPPTVLLEMAQKPDEGK